MSAIGPSPTFAALDQFSCFRSEADIGDNRDGYNRRGAASQTGGHYWCGMVLPEWIEHSTSPLPRGCSTTELRQQENERTKIGAARTRRKLPYGFRRRKAMTRLAKRSDGRINARMTRPGKDRDKTRIRRKNRLAGCSSGGGATRKFAPAQSAGTAGGARRRERMRR